MNYIKDVLAELMARLPELEWKSTKLGPATFLQQIPKGLFKSREELTAAVCVSEIEADIQLLAQHDHEASAVYLAEQIKKKINVLVSLCQLEGRKKKKSVAPTLGVAMLSTRQQRLHHMEHEIQVLQQQQRALTTTLINIQPATDPLVLLRLKAELGELEQRLTLAQEAFKKATS